MRARTVTTVADPRDDRAGDSYELFADLLAHNDRFVVRLNHDRHVETDDGAGTFSTVMPREALGERQVTLAARHRGNRPQQAQKNIPRARSASRRCDPRPASCR